MNVTGRTSQRIQRTREIGSIRMIGKLLIAHALKRKKKKKGGKSNLAKIVPRISYNSGDP